MPWIKVGREWQEQQVVEAFLETCSQDGFRAQKCQEGGQDLSVWEGVGRGDSCWRLFSRPQSCSTLIF